MQTLYNSDSFAVVAFNVPAEEGASTGAHVSADGSADATAGAASPAAPGRARGGFEIVDKLAQKEIFSEGAVAQSFQLGVQALVAQADSPDAVQAALDDYIAAYTTLAQQPVVLH